MRRRQSYFDKWYAIANKNSVFLKHEILKRKNIRAWTMWASRSVSIPNYLNERKTPSFLKSEFWTWGYCHFSNFSKNPPKKVRTLQKFFRKYFFFQSFFQYQLKVGITATSSLWAIVSNSTQSLSAVLILFFCDMKYFQFSCAKMELELKMKNYQNHLFIILN